MRVLQRDTGRGGWNINISGVHFGLITRPSRTSQRGRHEVLDPGTGIYSISQRYFTAGDRRHLRSGNDHDLRRRELISKKDLPSIVGLLEGGKGLHDRRYDPARVRDVSKFRQVNAWRGER